MFIKRASGTGAASSGGSGLGDAGYAAGHPATVEFLTLEKWPDDKPRELGSLKLFVQDGRWKCLLNDPDGRRSACVTADTLTDLMGTVERKLVDDSLDWRTWNGSYGKKRK